MRFAGSLGSTSFLILCVFGKSIYWAGKSAYCGNSLILSYLLLQKNRCEGAFGVSLHMCFPLFKLVPPIDNRFLLSLLVVA